MYSTNVSTHVLCNDLLLILYAAYDYVHCILFLLCFTRCMILFIAFVFYALFCYTVYIDVIHFFLSLMNRHCNDLLLLCNDLLFDFIRCVRLCTLHFVFLMLYTLYDFIYCFCILRFVLLYCLYRRNSLLSSSLPYVFSSSQNYDLN